MVDDAPRDDAPREEREGSRARTAGRVLRWALGGLAAVVALVLLALLVVPRTDWARRQVRTAVEDAVEGRLDGSVRIGAVRGNLLREAVFHEVVVRDAEGEPVAEIGRIEVRYALTPLLGRRIRLTGLDVVDPRVTLEQDAGGRWNVAELWSGGEAEPVDTAGAPGFGSWIRIDEARVRGGRVMMRTPVTEDADTGRVRIEELDGRRRVVREARDVDAVGRDLVLADPEAPVSGRLASLSAELLPFRPPPLRVEHLEGRFELGEDSVRVADVALDLPDSRLTGRGSLARESGAGRVRLRVERLSAGDLAWLDPGLPPGGSVSLDAAIVRTEDGALELAASDVRGEAGGASVTGRAAVRPGDPLRLGVVDLRFEGLDATVLRDLAGLEVPLDGTVAGRVRATPRSGDYDASVRVEATLDHRSRSAGRSRVRLAGPVELAGPAVRDLTVELSPLQVAAVEPLSGGLPVDGAVEGRVELTGSPDGPVRADLDLRHRGASGRTRVAGSVRLDRRDAPREAGDPALDGGPGRRIEARLRLPVVALGTAGAFVPSAGLRGTVRGRLDVEGPMSRLAFDLDLSAEGGGAVALSGTVDAERPGRTYDVRATFDRFDGSAVSDRAPGTRLGGTVAVRGEGTDPATLEATLRADLRDEAPDSLVPRWLRSPRSLEAEATLRGGLLRVERATARVASASADLEGTFGVADGRRGEMEVRLAVDSLADFAALLPAGEAEQEDQAEQGDRTEREGDAEQGDRAERGDPTDRQAREDQADPMDRERREEREGREETPARGEVPQPAGRIEVAATFSGNVDRVGARAEVRGEGLAVSGVRTDELAASVTARDLGAERPEWTADLRADSVLAAGLAYERLEARLTHAGSATDGAGSAAVTLVQDPDRDYRARIAYLLEADARELRVEELALRFDTVRWSSTGPGTVRWAGTGVAVDSLELRSDAGGRVFVSGRYGGEGPAPGPDDRLVRDLDQLALSQARGLMQDPLEASGRLGLRLRATGPAAEGRVTLELTLDEPTYGETALPDLRADAEYRPGDLRGAVRLLAREETAGAPGDTLLAADGEAALDVFGAGLDVSREIDVVIRADSLPLEGLPRFTDAVSDVRGRLRADLSVRGTVDAPEPAGEVALDLGRLDVDWPNVRLRDAVGAVRIEGETVVLDSLRARSGGGLLRLAGSADLADAGRPRVELTMLASDAQVLDNEIGRDVRIDGEVGVEGPLDSLAVGGAIRLREGVFFVPEGGGEAVDLDDAASRRALASMEVERDRVVSRSPVLQGLRVQVDLFVSRNTWVRMSDGTVEIRTPEDGDPLRIRYDPSEARLVLDGSVNADRGEYQFAGRRFELRSGTATFLPTRSVDPLLALTATHEVPRPGREALSIRIHVAGRLQEPRVVLTSNANPPLSQTDLISYLVFGAPSGSLLQPGSSALAGGGGGELGALATQQLASLAVGALVEEAFASVERSATESGLDVVHIEPAELPDELAFDGYFQNLLRGTQIEAGTYLTQRLFLGASGRATTEVWPGLNVEYRGPGGFRWRAMWEPRYLPSAPAFDPDLRATRTRVLGGFLFWESRPGAAAGGAAPDEAGVQQEPEAGADP